MAQMLCPLVRVREHGEDHRVRGAGDRDEAVAYVFSTQRKGDDGLLLQATSGSDLWQVSWRCPVDSKYGKNKRIDGAGVTDVVRKAMHPGAHGEGLYNFKITREGGGLSIKIVEHGDFSLTVANIALEEVNLFDGVADHLLGC